MNTTMEAGMMTSSFKKNTYASSSFRANAWQESSDGRPGGRVLIILLITVNEFPASKFHAIGEW